jgi:hypothetical protein
VSTETGQLQSTRPVEIGALSLFAAPATGGFSTLFPGGETVTVEFDPPSDATAVSARPDRYAELEAILVPESERKSNNYVGYALIIDLGRLSEDFEKVGDA